MMLRSWAACTQLTRSMQALPSVTPVMSLQHGISMAVDTLHGLRTYIGAAACSLFYSQCE
jgi:hypothetical protein